jgi:hypothetical protein
MNEAVGTPLSDDEMLARFVLKKEWLRKIDNTIKQDAFIPPKICSFPLLATREFPPNS